MTARYAHVSIELGTFIGIDHAARGMAAAARSAPEPFDVITLSATSREEEVIQIQTYQPWPVAQKLQRLFRYRTIAAANLDRYDVIFLRYPMSIDLNPNALFGRYRRFAGKIATVHHTKEVEELASAPRTVAMLARLALESVNGRRALSRADGIVGVTDEIRAYELARAGTPKPSTTISNGIDVDSIPFSRSAHFDGKTLRVVFVASAIARWHGWDRLREALRTHRGAVKIEVDAVGGFGEAAGSTELGERCRINYHGILRRDELSAVMARANIAISSLALQRIGLRQACVLKTREYTARGIPFVYAYDDADLRADDSFCLRVASGDTPLDLEEIIEFAARVSGSSTIGDAARSTAKMRMDWTRKVSQFIEFGQLLAQG